MVDAVCGNVWLLRGAVWVLLAAVQPPPEGAEQGQARKSKIYSKSGMRKEAVLWRFLARRVAQAGLSAGAPLEVGSTARGQTDDPVGW